MARLIQHEADGPFELPPSPKPTYICMCGLTKNAPLCDGSHKLCRQQEEEGKLYHYEEDQAIEVEGA